MEQLRCSRIPCALVETKVANSLIIGGSFWLRYWADHNTEAGGNADVGKYIGIYFAFGIGSSLLTVCQTLILWIFCSIEVRIATRAQLGMLLMTMYRRPESCTREWQLPFSGHQCPSSTSHLPVEF